MILLPHVAPPDTFAVVRLNRQQPNLSSLQAVLCAPDDAAATALAALLRSGHLQAHCQPGARDCSPAAEAAQVPAPAPGGVTLCLAAAAFSMPVAADEAAQHAWNRQLAALLPWLLPQHVAKAVPPDCETPLLPRRNGFSGGGEPGSSPQSALACRKERAVHCGSDTLSA